MNTLINFNSIAHLVSSVAPYTGYMVQGVKVTLSNGYTLSIIQGSHAYCDANTFEVAVIGDDGLIESFGDEGVLGYQTPEDIRLIALQVSSL